ncbi:efflux RND transporter periplasmic adaptor subunit [Hymenobacter sp. BT770]|uniref:efflux RND transporter periplasmic adaptor subunit n=1 Tax=Hymenobacter sp. BT770 TaxID=2886942 RepID=UPI001D10B518|nr:efflux RND transporter periplasmic adaptor subunit [Hymenobacter sp. BT770]MCC3152296.1 efflux RND transporter periplasmic adaptor subunit [Hymenobacter sp. BT770]MDO3414109.1 efflux RND transporter periplasmic adaptor subunit [Hymenobacter sp. BT770]
MSEPTTSSSRRFWLIILIVLAVFGGLFLLGYMPRHSREKARDNEASQNAAAAPTVTVVAAQAAPDTTTLTLPADTRSNRETFVFARANGYVKSWSADIGQKVKAGQVLAEVTTPELDQQIAEARATLGLARTSYNRLAGIGLPGAISKQELDAAQAQYAAQRAGVQQLLAQQAFRRVTAPFSGIVTQRNVEVGSLVNSSNTPGSHLYKLEQTDKLRAYVQVPQNFAPAIKPGLTADFLVPEFPGRVFAGRVVREAGALDANTRTLLTEVEVPNPRGELRPGSYAQVRFQLPRTSPGVLIPANALVPGGTDVRVATVQDGKIHYQPITTGRDFGSQLEVAQGLKGGELLVLNPAETLTEGQAVQTRDYKPAPKPAGPPPAKPRPNDPDAPRVSSPALLK